MFRRFSLLIVLGVCALQVHGQNLNAGQFPGLTVGDKIAAAQTQGCISGMSCVITISPELSVWPAGTWPTRCALCTWIDLTVAGSYTVTPTNVKTMNNVRYVDQFPGAELGAQLRAARDDIAATGGTIMLPAKSDGSCYTMNTQVTFSTIGKAVSVVGTGVGTLGNTGKTAQTGPCINWTPTSAGAAFIVDWGSSGGDTSYAGSGGFYNVQLINNQCVTNGGCGSSAVGIQVGGTNGGARGFRLQDTSIMGFGKATVHSDAAGVGWGWNWIAGSCAFNTTCNSYEATNNENDQYFGVKFVSNGKHFDIPSGKVSDISLFGGSMDSALTCGVNNAGLNSRFNAFGVHWENLGVTNLQYTCDSNASLSLFIYGGQAIDDTSGGSTAQNWFSSSQTHISGLYLFGGVAGRTYSGKVFNLGDVGFVNVWNGSPTALPSATICALATPCYLSNVNHNGGEVIYPNFTSLALKVNSSWPLISGTAPTIASGFGTGPTITQVNGVASFAVNIGTTPGSTGTLNMPTAGDGWSCFANDVTSPTTGGGYLVKQTGGTVSTVILTFYSTAGAATAPTASDKIQVNCMAY